MSAMTAEVVEWLDSCSPRGWTVRSAMTNYSPDKVVSIGFVLNEAEEHLTLAPHWSKECADGILCIPKCSITRRTPVRLPRLAILTEGGQG